MDRRDRRNRRKGWGRRALLSVALAVALCLVPGEALRAQAAQETQEEKDEDAGSGETKNGGPETSGASAIVIESSTGEVVCEKNADEALPPASVTKVMTLLLIFDAIEDGKISLSDTVTTSEHAASMGGSQVFLEAGETQSVETMIKCITVASANDACAAMAELVAGSEDTFVAQMNEKAQELGMEHTHFENCTGLDADGHLTCARDIAVMSRELTTRHPEIFNYTKIWMEDITHKTKKGETTFGLSNTNKLIRQYEYATGLKTGSTGKAGFCLSATASRDGIDLIAVVMAEPDSKTRVKDSIALLNYGFSVVSRYADDPSDAVAGKTVAVRGGEEDTVQATVQDTFSCIDLNGKNFSDVKRTIRLSETIDAPVKKGDVVGSVEYTLDGETLGTVDLLAEKSVAKLSFLGALLRTVKDAAIG